MNIKNRFETLVIDVTTSRRDGSASLQVSNSKTRVYYGDLHARVEMLDLNLEIVMDPTPGDWGNAKWAREKAFESLKEALEPQHIAQMLKIGFKNGKREGAEEARETIRAALGIGRCGAYLVPWSPKG